MKTLDGCFCGLGLVCEYEMAQNVALALGCRLPTWAEYVHRLPADEAHAVAVAERNTLHGNLREVHLAAKPMMREVENVFYVLALPLLTACLWAAKLCARIRDRRTGGD